MPGRTEIIAQLRPYLSVGSEFMFKKDVSTPLLKKYPCIRKEAAVLVPLIVRSNGDIELLFTLRSDAVRHHKNEVCFPGGSREPGDANPADTALRETFEEIGLPRSYVELMGCSVPYFTRAHYLMVPVLGFIEESKLSRFKPIANPEVTATFSLPLERFLSARNHEILNFTMNSKSFGAHVFRDTVPNLSSDDGAMVGVNTFGLTAMIAIEIASLLFEKAPEFNVSSVIVQQLGARLSVDQVKQKQKDRLIDSLEQFKDFLPSRL